MGISLSVHYLNNQHPSKIRHSISRSMYHSSLEEITKIVTLEKTKINHSEMAFNLKWSVIFTLVMVGQFRKFGSAMPQSAVFEGEDHEAVPLEAVTSPSEGEDLETVPLEAMPQRTRSLTPEMLERAFERLDENGNNFISKREFFQGVESFYEDTNNPKEVSRNSLNVLFNDLDKNNDGKLDIEEFKKFELLAARRLCGTGICFLTGVALAGMGGAAVGLTLSALGLG